jgi:flagellar hook protein FlgE
MSFQQGLSGLNAASKQLEVIGNNVSNANTVGFKQSRAEFADVFANSLSGGGASQIGIGTKVSNVAQQYTQGNITATNNSLDIAINGGGFFRMSNNGSVTYSRNGQFQMDKDGYIVDATSKRLTGYSAGPTGGLSTGAPAELRIDTGDLQPSATTEIVGLINLDSRKTGAHCSWV